MSQRHNPQRPATRGQPSVRQCDKGFVGFHHGCPRLSRSGLLTGRLRTSVGCSTLLAALPDHMERRYAAQGQRSPLARLSALFSRRCSRGKGPVLILHRLNAHKVGFQILRQLCCQTSSFSYRHICTAMGLSPLESALIETWTLYGIGTLAFMLRVFSRARLGVSGYCIDDYTIIFAWVSLSASHIQ